MDHKDRESLPQHHFNKNKYKRLVDTIDRLLQLKATSNLNKLLMRIMPVDLAQVMESFAADEAREIFLLIPDIKHAAMVLKELPIFFQQTILSETPPTQLLPILETLPPDTRADIIGRLEPELASRYMGKMDVLIQRELKSLMQYPADTAGGLMTSQFFALNEVTTVAEAIQAVRGLAALEMVFYLYVVNMEGNLTGVSSLRQLLLADPNLSLGQMMNPKVVKIHVDTPQSEVADIVARYRLLAVPVIDERGKMLGLVTVDDVMDVMEQETTDELFKLAGTSGSEIDVQSPWKVFQIRLPWMILSLIGGMASSLIVMFFDQNLKLALILTAFLPLMLGLTGNFGSVVATVVACTISTGQVSRHQYLTLLWRELRTGVMMGGLLALLAVWLSWWLFHDPFVAQTVGLTLLVNMLMATLIAATMPALFKRFGADPSLAQGPIVVMVLHVVSVTSYLLIATLLQQHTGG
ncbi:MAG: magnesium transporter [Magnetococcus sp. YQC-5]